MFKKIAFRSAVVFWVLAFVLAGSGYNSQAEMVEMGLSDRISIAAILNGSVGAFALAVMVSLVYLVARIFGKKG